MEDCEETPLILSARIEAVEMLLKTAPIAAVGGGSDGGSTVEGKEDVVGCVESLMWPLIVLPSRYFMTISSLCSLSIHEVKPGCLYLWGMRPKEVYLQAPVEMGYTERERSSPALRRQHVGVFFPHMPFGLFWVLEQRFLDGKL